MAEPRCKKDFFTFIEKGDKNCGCKVSDEEPMAVAESEDAVCYKVTGPYHRVGRGIAGDVHWFTGCEEDKVQNQPFIFSFGDDIQKCFEAVQAHPDVCEQDYFTYNTRSDQGCGCRKKGSVFNVLTSDCSDFYETCMPVCKPADTTTTTTNPCDVWNSGVQKDFIIQAPVQEGESLCFENPWAGTLQEVSNLGAGGAWTALPSTSGFQVWVTKAQPQPEQCPDGRCTIEQCCEPLSCPTGGVGGWWIRDAGR